MCKAGTVPALIAGMNAHNSDKKLLRVGLEMISNFAAADDEEIDHEATEMLLTQGDPATKGRDREAPNRCDADALHV